MASYVLRKSLAAAAVISQASVTAIMNQAARVFASGAIGGRKLRGMARNRARAVLVASWAFERNVVGDARRERIVLSAAVALQARLRASRMKYI